MALIVLPFRDNHINFIKYDCILKSGELAVCYEENGHRIYKIGDGKSNIDSLPDIDLNTIDSFNIYERTSDKPSMTIYLNPEKFFEEGKRDGKDI